MIVGVFNHDISIWVLSIPMNDIFIVKIQNARMIIQ